MIRQYRVGWLFTISGTPIQDATLLVEDGRILGVEEGEAGPAATDLRNWAVMPALVNAHTHLEFSHLTQPLGTEGMSFPQWITEVIRYRQGFGEDIAREKAVAIHDGLKQSASHGVGAVGEIATLPLTEASYAQSDVHVVSLLEVLGLDPDRVTQGLARAEEHALYPWSQPNVSAGVSPHAPYSLKREVVEHCVSLSAAKGLPLAMHLAETTQELELLEEGTGPFRVMLDNMGLFRTEDFPGGRRVLDYLKLLAPAYRAMVVHGNYLSEHEIAFLAEHAETMSVCYCPRTHAYFHHDPHPIEELLAQGVPVVLGTDSRSSNPDLNLWKEVQHVQREFPDIPESQLLNMVTRDAAFALGIEDVFGTIERGKSARVAAFPIVPDTPDVLSAMLAGQPRLWNLDGELSEFDLATA
ncbi:amidohydrolase family protein [Blastopirellula marina]|uniref:Chlorohydrolase n=1 Tax=Blastopirellula marina TaxID=124 RepID=A0A2S8GCD1_9BACT|nr:amidohydrolase family protein [Blastopirellula marina]PQO42118.1 chlorohydrolase [Blastopirellula marina]